MTPGRRTRRECPAGPVRGRPTQRTPRAIADTLGTLNNLGAVYHAAGRLPESIALLERVRDAEIAKLGPDHPQTLATLGQLAGAYQNAGRLPEAITLLRVPPRLLQEYALSPCDLSVSHDQSACFYRVCGLSERTKKTSLTFDGYRPGNGLTFSVDMCPGKLPSSLFFDSGPIPGP